MYYLNKALYVSVSLAMKSNYIDMTLKTALMHISAHLKAKKVSDFGKSSKCGVKGFIPI